MSLCPTDKAAPGYDDSLKRERQKIKGSLRLVAVDPVNQHRLHALLLPLMSLLVVITIIAILAALLLPALSGAKEKRVAWFARTSCHQFYLAAHMYAADNTEILPTDATTTGTR